ncbi:hypothetical protein SAV14893_062360 [Streptomyces avermitilis]|uniref:4Fe-4S Mo/W bis-MGD-type domain-containing protein n=1 Tax=Streptomyces avermitilis TaxID=33903 RepID=A0A4D4M4T2_STRAX|nr:hypothetical protein SAV14893_062360 [Streptomyces avermitilis]
MSRTALRICPLCEATCGLTLTIEGTRVTKARGDRDDVFSKGFICPKGASFGAADGDPDRLRTPLVREDGELREATWEEAFDAVAAGLRPVVEEHGPHAVGVVLGNPNVHTMAGALYPPVLLAGLRTHSLFTASTVDQMPKHVSSGLLYGDAVAIPVPDLDRTDHLLLLGANPSNPTEVSAPPPTSPASSRPSRPAAAPSPSSTRAAPAPPSSPTGTSPSAPAPTHCCSRRWRTCSSRSGSSTSGSSPRMSRASTNSPTR